MAKKLWAIANATGSNVTYTSTEYPGDTANIPANTIMQTGGTDDNFVKIADCSDPQYYNDHHCLISADQDQWSLSFWDNDDQNNLLYFSTNGTYAGGKSYPGSDKYESCMILIYMSNGKLVWNVGVFNT